MRVTLVAMISCLFSPSVYEAILPRPAVRTVDWAAEQVSTPAGSEIKGKVRWDLFPYMVEPIDCVDDPRYELVTVQGGSRIGKTFGSQVVLAKTAARNPHPMAFADADESSTRRVLKRTWSLFETVDDLSAKLPPKRLQSSERMELVDCLVHGCWSGSPSTAADFAAMLVVLNEIDKMSHRKSSEADFAYLMRERAKGYHNATVLEISTPALTGESRIETSRLAGDNRAFYVPCPHCNHRQTLRTGDGKTPGGIRFDKTKKRGLDKDLARESAWYECEKCQKRIRDEHRYDMINSGVWVPEGCKIDKRGRIRGKPKRQGTHASFGPIGTHYSLLNMTWGRIAYQFVDAVQDKSGKKLRHYTNSWEGRTWDPTPRRVEPTLVAARLRDDSVPLKVCPPWTRFLTIAADVGSAADALIFYWGVCAWGPNQRGHLVDYGAAAGETEFVRWLIGCSFPKQGDSHVTFQPVRGGLDAGSGVHANRVYQICNGISGVWPVKGSTNDIGDICKSGYQHEGVTAEALQAKRAAGAADLLWVNTPLSQAWIEELVNGIVDRSKPAWFSLPAEAADDPDLVEQLLADRQEPSAKTGKTIWTKVADNEARDWLRYNWALAWQFTRGGTLWSDPPLMVSTGAPARPDSRVLVPGDTRPDGRPWLD